MAAPFIIWSFDPGVNLGFCVGDARAKATPASRLVRLAKDREGAALLKFWQAELKLGRPALVFKEAGLEPAAMARVGMSGVAIEKTLGLHFLLKTLADAYSIPIKEEKPDRIRKHFIGAGRLGTREATNRAVISRAQVLGYMPRDVFDWDRANACAGWDYAKAHFARLPPEMLVLFGEGQT